MPSNGTTEQNMKEPCNFPAISNYWKKRDLHAKAHKKFFSETAGIGIPFLTKFPEVAPETFQDEPL